MGAEALRVLLSMPRGNLAPIAGLSRVVKMKRRVPSAAKVARALEMVQKDPKTVGATEWTFAKETVPAPASEIPAIRMAPAIPDVIAITSGWSCVESPLTASPPTNSESTRIVSPAEMLDLIESNR